MVSSAAVTTRGACGRHGAGDDARSNDTLSRFSTPSRNVTTAVRVTKPFDSIWREYWIPASTGPAIAPESPAGRNLRGGVAAPAGCLSSRAVHWPEERTRRDALSLTTR